MDNMNGPILGSDATLRVPHALIGLVSLVIALASGGCRPAAPSQDVIKLDDTTRQSEVQTASGAAGAPSNVRRDSSLTASAALVYSAELAAMRAYAREACGECPAEAPGFLSGSRYAFERAVALHPEDPDALLGLANVLFSSGFLDAGEPIDTVLSMAELLAKRAATVAPDDSTRAVAETLAARIGRSR